MKKMTTRMLLMLLICALTSGVLIYCSLGNAGKNTVEKVTEEVSDNLEYDKLGEGPGDGWYLVFTAPIAGMAYLAAGFFVVIMLLVIPISVYMFMLALLLISKIIQLFDKNGKCLAANRGLTYVSIFLHGFLCVIYVFSLPYFSGFGLIMPILYTGFNITCLVWSIKEVKKYKPIKMIKPEAMA